MKTVDKAMHLLNRFSIEQTEIGLSELARLADLDKAATRRLLVALAKHGYIEQSADTRKYRLGAGFLGLARIREATVPLARAAQEACDWLTAVTDETTHVSVPMADYMSTIAYTLPKRGNIINIIPAQPLPFHATATGYAYLAAATPATLKHALSIKRSKPTRHTLTSKSDVLRTVRETQARGHAHCCGLFEDGVSSLAVAFFAGGTEPAGTVSLAMPDDRLRSADQARLLADIKAAATRIENAITGP